MVKIVRRHGKLVRVTTQPQSGTPAKRRPCGCGDRDVAAIARASAEMAIARASAEIEGDA